MIKLFLMRARSISPFVWFSLSFCCFITAIFSAYFILDNDDFESGVYRIVVSTKLGGFGHGSGFKVSSDGYILTNEHVIDNARKISVVYSENDKVKWVDADIVWYNSDKDLALIKTNETLPGSIRTLVDIIDDQVLKAKSVIAVGFPGIGDRVTKLLQGSFSGGTEVQQTYLDPTVSKGSVQRVVPTLERLTIQHSADISAGNSGGPLFDQCSRVIGVNTFIFAEKLKFAVDVREAFSGLREKGVDYTVSNSSCYGGYLVHEFISLGLASVLTIAFLGGAFIALPHHPQGRLQDSVFSKILAAPSIQSSAVTTIPQLVVNDTGQKLPLTAIYSENGRGLCDYMTIGRSSADADLAIKNSSLSRTHAKIGKVGENYVLHDLNSTNGTYSEGTRITAERGLALRHGQKILLGDASVTFELIDKHMTFEENDPINNGRTKKPKDWNLEGTDTLGNIIRAKLSEKKSLGQRDGMKTILYVGRDGSNTLVIAENSISRRHACFGISNFGALHVCDLGSANGTYVDNIPVGSAWVQLRDGQTVRFGSIELELKPAIS